MGCVKSRERFSPADGEECNNSRKTCGCWTAIRKSLSRSKRAKSSMDDDISDSSSESSVASITSADAFEPVALGSSSIPAILGQESEKASAPLLSSSSCSSASDVMEVEDEEPSTSYERDRIVSPPPFLPYQDDDSSYESSSSESRPDDVISDFAAGTPFEDVVGVVKQANERFILRASLVWTLNRITYHFVFLSGLRLHGSVRFRFFLPDLHILPQAHLQIMDDDWGVWAGERDDEEDEERAMISSGETAYLAAQGPAGFASTVWAFIGHIIDAVARSCRLFPHFDVDVEEEDRWRQEEEEEEDEEEEK